MSPGMLTNMIAAGAVLFGAIFFAHCLAQSVQGFNAKAMALTPQHQQ